MKKAIAVDFDGCLCKDKYPGIGKANVSVIRSLIKYRKAGAKVILWTCRDGDLLARAVAWCARNGLHFDAVNDNLPERVAKYGSNSRKVSADEYWDDKAKRVKCT